jgi:hypothetical protein
MERRQANLLLVLTCVVNIHWVAGCSSDASVTITTNIPNPLIEQVPINVAIYYDDTMSQYVHSEDLGSYGNHTIDLRSQISVFNRIFDAMFKSITPVDSIDSAQGRSADAILAPSIEKFQFAIPEQTRKDYYEVWIQYRFELYGADGSLIHSWPVTAYGKANRLNYGGLQSEKSPALREAVTWALRDAAASISFSFARQDVVREWIQQRVAS